MPDTLLVKRLSDAFNVTQDNNDLKKVVDWKDIAPDAPASPLNALSAKSGVYLHTTAAGDTNYPTGATGGVLSVFTLDNANYKRTYFGSVSAYHDGAEWHVGGGSSTYEPIDDVLFTVLIIGYGAGEYGGTLPSGFNEALIYIRDGVSFYRMFKTDDTGEVVRTGSTTGTDVHVKTY